VKIPPPSLSPERAKVDDYSAARSKIIPPLQWPTFSPPFSGEGVAFKDVHGGHEPASFIFYN
jgi:hypothetical protein